MNGQPINGATLRTYSATTTGDYSVFVTNTTTNCGKMSIVQTINTFLVPTVATIAAQGPIAIPTGGSVTMAVTNPNANFNYQWYSTNTAIAGALNTSYTASAAGTYRVKTVNGPCTSAYSNSIIVTITPGQVNMVDQDLNILEGAKEMIVFPNPTNQGLVTIEYEMENDGMVDISIFDINGRLIFIQGQDLTSGSQIITLNVDKLNEGMYTVVLNDGKNVQYGKLIKTN